MSLVGRLLAALIALWASSLLQAAVVINEIFYHAPEDIEDVQWLELYNSGDQPVDLTGWKLTEATQFAFPTGATIGPNEFIVICQDEKRFHEYYQVSIVGEFKRPLRRSGGILRLEDAAGKIVDQVRFSNQTPWPMSADGLSASLERISPSADGMTPFNWTASPLPTDELLPAGSPGTRNHAYSESIPPSIRRVTFAPTAPRPGEDIRVEAALDPAQEPARTVELRFRLVTPGSIDKETVVPMQSGGTGTYQATIPAGKDGSLIRLRIRATGPSGSHRYYPAETDLRPALSVYVQTPPAMATIPLAYVINTDPVDVTNAARYLKRARAGSDDLFGNPKRREALEKIDAAADLESLWAELTIEHAPDQPTYRGLREAFIAAAAERQAMIDEVISNANLQGQLQKLSERSGAYRHTLQAQVEKILSSEEKAAFQKRLAADGDSGPDGFFKQLLKIEGGWLALNRRFELTEGQRAALRPIYQKAIERRSIRNPALRNLEPGPAGFPTLQVVFGAAEKEMWAGQKAVLSSREARFLAQWYRDYGAFVRPRLTDVRPLPPQGRSAFVVVDPQSKQAEVFDFVNITERSAGYKVRLHRDHPYRGLRTVDVIFESKDRFVLAEPLAYDLYRRTGMPAPQTDFVRLTIDGHVIGYHLLFEQINRSFLRRNQRNPDGDLFKLIWYGCSLEAQHDQQNHSKAGHTNLLALIERLRATSGTEQWTVIEKNFNVDEVLNYFAVNMCISHWDGFFNNYFAYHDRRGTGKWEMYPWDQDKTWGYYDAIKPGEIFFNMPITFGMEGDLPPGGGPPRLDPRTWWRPGGYFSKPLLANPEFRKRFLQRTKEILDHQFTPEVMFPVFDRMAETVRPEITIRAAAIGEDPDAALKRLDANIASIKENLVKRREFLLNEPEIKALGKN